MNKLVLIAVMCLWAGSALAEPMAGPSRPEVAGGIAGLASACGGRQQPALREFIRQSMAAIESRARDLDELEAAMSRFNASFAGHRFAPGKPDCAAVEIRYQQAYGSLRTGQAGRQLVSRR